MVADSVYVYGITSEADGDPPPVQGVDDAEVRTLRHAGLIALASDMRPRRLLARDLRGHWRVLQRVFDQTTVVPLRFGTVLESDQEVRELLIDPNAERLAAMLEDLRGLVQLGVKGRYDEPELLRQIVRDNPQIERLRRGPPASAPGATPAEQLYLGQLVEAAISAQREADTKVALDALAPAARASRIEPVSHPAAFDLAFLVERSAQSALDDRVGLLRERLGARVELRYVGPLPPLSFVEDDGTAGGALWA